MTIIAEQSQYVKPFLDSNNESERFIWQADQYPYWYEVVNLITYSRTSPRKIAAAFSHTWQQNATKDIAKRYGKTILAHFQERGVSGHRFSRASRPQLFKAIALTQAMNGIDRTRPSKTVLLDTDLSRLQRNAAVLKKLKQCGIHILTVYPPDASPESLHGEFQKQTIAERERQTALAGDNRQLGEFLSLNFTYEG